MWKFCGKWQLSGLGFKFQDPWKTAGPSCDINAIGCLCFLDLLPVSTEAVTTAQLYSGVCFILSCNMHTVVRVHVYNKCLQVTVLLQLMCVLVCMKSSI